MGGEKDDAPSRGNRGAKVLDAGHADRLPGIPDQSLRPKQLRDDPPVLRGALPRHLADPCGGDRAAEGDGKVRFEDPAAKQADIVRDHENPHEKGAQHGERNDTGNPGEDTKCSVLEHVIDFQEDPPSMPVPTAASLPDASRASMRRASKACKRKAYRESTSNLCNGGADAAALECQGICETLHSLQTLWPRPPRDVFFKPLRNPIAPFVEAMIAPRGGEFQRGLFSPIRDPDLVYFNVRWRGGRAAEGGGLENRWAATSRRFESCSLRHPPSPKVRDGKS